MVPHALLIPPPAQGHVMPMMQLAWKLVSDGFLVTFLNSDSNHNRILQGNTLNSFDNIRRISVPFEFQATPFPKSMADSMEALEKAMGPAVIDTVIQEINAREEENKLTCMIADVWMCFGLHPVAKLHNLALAAFDTALVSVFAMRYFSSSLVSLGILPSDGIPKEDNNKISSIHASAAFWRSSVGRRIHVSERDSHDRGNQANQMGSFQFFP